jgi:hypothetical protein
MPLEDAHRQPARGDRARGGEAGYARADNGNVDLG